MTGGDRQGVARPVLPALHLTGARAAPGPGISPFLHSFPARMKPSLVRCCCRLPRAALVVPAWAPSRTGEHRCESAAPQGCTASPASLLGKKEEKPQSCAPEWHLPGEEDHQICELCVQLLSCFLERRFLFKAIVPELPAAAHTLRSKAPWLQPHLSTDRDLTLWLSNRATRIFNSLSI